MRRPVMVTRSAGRSSCCCCGRWWWARPCSTTVSAAAATRSGSCPQAAKPTPRRDLPRALQVVDASGLIGDCTPWTTPRDRPDYVPGDGGWQWSKQPWFRLENGPVAVSGRRAHGGTGTFHFEMPPVASYPLDLNASIGPGFIPSLLEFSTGGCWKVTGRLGRSRVVLFVDIDDSKAVICAQLADDLSRVEAVHVLRAGPGRDDRRGSAAPRVRDLSSSPPCSFSFVDLQ